MSKREKEENKQKEAPVWTPAFFMIVAIMFTSYISFHGLNSGTSVYIDIKGGTAQFAGILASIYSLTASAARFFMGPLIDEKGRALIMKVGAASFTIGALLVAIFPSDAMLVVGRILQGIGFGSLTTSAAAAAADVLPKSRLGEGLSYYTLGNALAQSVGPAIGLFLVALNPPEIMYFVLAGASVIVFVLAMMTRYEIDPTILPETSNYRIRMESAKEAGEDAKPKNTAKGLARYIEPKAICGGVPMGFMASANCFSVFFAGLYGASLGLINGGIYFTFSAVSMVAVRAISKGYMDRVLPLINLGVSVVAGLIGLGCLLAAPYATWLFYVAGFMYGVELGITLPVNQSVSVKNTPEDRWGAGNALFSIIMDLGVVIFSIVWGTLNDNFGFSASIMGAMACMVVAFIMALVLYPKWAKVPSAWEEFKEASKR